MRTFFLFRGFNIPKTGVVQTRDSGLSAEHSGLDRSLAEVDPLSGAARSSQLGNVGNICCLANLRHVAT